MTPEHVESVKNATHSLDQYIGKLCDAMESLKSGVKLGRVTLPEVVYLQSKAVDLHDEIERTSGMNNVL